MLTEPGGILVYAVGKPVPPGIARRLRGFGNLYRGLGVDAGVDVRESPRRPASCAIIMLA